MYNVALLIYIHVHMQSESQKNVHFDSRDFSRVPDGDVLTIIDITGKSGRWWTITENVRRLSLKTNELCAIESDHPKL